MSFSAPEGYQAANTYLCIKNASDAIEFYTKAFGATERMRLNLPDGKIMHAEIQFGDVVIMISDELPDWGMLSPSSLGGSPASIMLYVEDADIAFKRAIDAGATENMPVEDQFWGDRMGSVMDPFGYKWSLTTQIEKVDPAEIQQRFDAWMQSQDC